MKILHVITTLDTGGAERLMVDLLPQLRDKGYDVELLLFNGVMTPFRKELEQQGIPIHELANLQGNAKHTEVYNPLNILRLRKYLHGYDIIHTHNTASQLYVPLAKMLTRSCSLLVATEHNTTNRRRSMAWFKPVDRWMYGRYAAVICIAEQTLENLKRHIGQRSTLCTIHNGVDIARFIKPVRDIAGKEKFVITMVAAFRPQKDHTTLLRAMLHLPEQFTLQLAGQGETEMEMKSLCHRLGLDERMNFLGMRADVPDIMEHSDIIVLSSHWEGFGLAAVEGMASGRPLVASDVEGLKDIVAGAGVLFPHGDEEALARAIQDLCENPVRYREVAAACQERAKCYDISRMADGYDKLYRSLYKS